MDQSTFSVRTRKARSKSELYSTVVVHDDEDGDGDGGGYDKRDQSRRGQNAKSSGPEGDPYATMVYKDNGREEDEDDDSSLPPLLKRLPKDFGGGASMDYEDDPDDDGGDFGTMIVKTDRSRQRNLSSSGSTWKSRKSPSSYASPMTGLGAGEDEDDDGDQGFSTFVVRSTARSSERESVSGTVVRRTSAGVGSGGTGAGSTMERAVASMQASGELGFGKQRRGSNDEGRQSIGTKVSSSSIPESVTREDPTTKYELLNELGGLQFEFIPVIFISILFYFPFEFFFTFIYYILVFQCLFTSQRTIFWNSLDFSGT